MKTLTVIGKTFGLLVGFWLLGCFIWNAALTLRSKFQNSPPQPEVVITPEED